MAMARTAERKQEDSMEERLQWIEHQKARILSADFSGIRDEEQYLKAIDALEAEILRQPAGSLVPLLLDVSNTVLTPKINERSKQMTAVAREKGIPDSPTALVGLSGAQKAVVQLMQFFRQGLRIANSLEEAKDWLAEQVGRP